MKNKLINAIIVLDFIATACVLVVLYERAQEDCPGTAGFVRCVK